VADVIQLANFVLRALVILGKVPEAEAVIKRITERYPFKDLFNYALHEGIAQEMFSLVLRLSEITGRFPVDDHTWRRFMADAFPPEGYEAAKYARCLACNAIRHNLPDAAKKLEKADGLAKNCDAMKQNLLPSVKFLKLVYRRKQRHGEAWMSGDWTLRERKLLEAIVFDCAKADYNEIPYMQVVAAYGLLAKEAGDPEAFMSVKGRAVDRWKKGMRNVCLFDLDALFDVLRANGMLQSSELVVQRHARR
jgi:hypothetical protein